MIRDNRFSLFLFSRQLGKTTIATIYCLWSVIFNDDYKVLIVANKESTAKEIFKRIRLAYEELPNWLKAPVNYYGMESMELSNGSRIGISTTTGTAARGQSANLLFVDEADWIECIEGGCQIEIKNKKTQEIKKITVKEAYDLLQDEKLDVNDLGILSDDGWKSFTGIIKNENINTVKLKFDDGTELICSENHELLTSSGNFTYANKSRYKKIVSKSGLKKVVSICKHEYITTYDVTDVDGSRYYTNDVISHNCNMLNEFWASVYPIISSSKKSKVILASTPRDTSGLFYKLYSESLNGKNNWVSMKVLWNEVPGRDEKWKLETMSSMSNPALFKREFECEFDQIGDSQLDGLLYEEFKKNTRQPLYSLDEGLYNIWENPNPERIYVAGVDIAEGVGKDYSVIQILDITDPRFIQQVAVYANNKITPLEFTPKLRQILQNWGDPLALIERNSCGSQVVDNLKKDFNYENIVSWGNKHTTLNDMYRPMHLGMVSHTNTKYKAIMNQQYWVATTKRVHINDLHTINELKDFVKMKNSTFSAKAGSHDDRVMSLVWALMILHPEITERYFEILDKDEHHMPVIIKPMDYGVNYFMNSTSIYTNSKESIGGDALPTFLGSPTFTENPDIDDLYNAGYKRLY